MAYTVSYKLSQPAAELYAAVTAYVRDEFNRAEALQNDKRAGTVGFALTVLQRRLASSPEAIYQSLRRRRERLDSRLRELELLQRAGQTFAEASKEVPELDDEDVEDLDEAPDSELQEVEEQILDQATAARSIAELKTEIGILKGLEGLALSVRRAVDADTKWRELASLLSEVFTSDAIANRSEDVARSSVPVPAIVSSPTQKIVIFTEHRDTLSRACCFFMRSRTPSSASARLKVTLPFESPQTVCSSDRSLIT